MRSLAALAIVSLTLCFSACKKDGESSEPSILDGVTKDVDNEVNNAGESFDRAVEDVEGAGNDISDAVSDDDNADADADDDANADSE